MAPRRSRKDDQQGASGRTPPPSNRYRGAGERSPSRARRSRTYVVCSNYAECQNWLWTSTHIKIGPGQSCNKCGALWPPPPPPSAGHPRGDGNGLSDQALVDLARKRGLAGADSLVAPEPPKPTTALGVAQAAERKFYQTTRDLAAATAAVSRLSGQITDLRNKLTEQEAALTEAQSTEMQSRKTSEEAFVAMQEAYREAAKREKPDTATAGGATPSTPPAVDIDATVAATLSKLPEGMVLTSEQFTALSSSLTANLSDSLKPSAVPPPAALADEAPTGTSAASEPPQGTRRGRPAAVCAGTQAAGDTMADEETEALPPESRRRIEAARSHLEGIKQEPARATSAPLPPGGRAEDSPFA